MKMYHNYSKTLTVKKKPVNYYAALQLPWYVYPGPGDGACPPLSAVWSVVALCSYQAECSETVGKKYLCRHLPWSWSRSTLTPFKIGLLYLNLQITSERLFINVCAISTENSASLWKWKKKKNHNYTIQHTADNWFPSNHDHNWE